mgnify:CR=1 FL=1
MPQFGYRLQDCFGTSGDLWIRFQIWTNSGPRPEFFADDVPILVPSDSEAVTWRPQPKQHSTLPPPCNSGHPSDSDALPLTYDRPQIIPDLFGDDSDNGYHGDDLNPPQEDYWCEELQDASGLDTSPDPGHAMEETESLLW